MTTARVEVAKVGDKRIVMMETPVRLTVAQVVHASTSLAKPYAHPRAVIQAVAVAVADIS